MTKLLENKVALITGGSRGIGAAIAKKFVTQGAHVVLVARDQEKLEEIDDQIQDLGGQATLLPFDLAHTERIPEIAKAIFDRFGRLDILVGNAGMLGQLCPTGDMSSSHFNHLMRVNVAANWHLIGACDPLLRAAPHGRALFTTTGDVLINGEMGFWGPYATSKAALNAMVKTYATEVNETNVRVNLISPGPVPTDMLEKAYPGGYPGDTTDVDLVAGVFLDFVRDDCTNHGEIIRVPTYLKEVKSA